jgi:hypothetical protein
VEIPETFEQTLAIEFQDRLRIRWSGKQQSFLIQQRVGPNLIGSVPRRLLDSEKRQDLAQGYRTIMNVSPSEIVKCPECSIKLNVPYKETRQIKCLYCQLKQRSTFIAAGYFPLDSSLINHLKSIDPIRQMDSDDVQRMQTHNDRISESQQKQLYDDAESYSSDNINQLMGILQTGYGGMKVKDGTEVKGIT